MQLNKLVIFFIETSNNRLKILKYIHSSKNKILYSILCLESRLCTYKQ